MSQLDGVSMEPEPLGDAMRLLSEAGERFGGEWQGYQGAISTGEAGIGGDRLAAAFRPKYQPAADSLKQAAGRIPGAFGAASAAGTASAADYVSSDADAAQRFRDLQ
jgi:hypothetical protein